jgi:hypothetical protein
VALHPDFLALIGCFAKARCRFIIVGGQALAANGRPRFTQDLDVLVEPGTRNAAKVAAAVADFGFGKLAEAIREEFRHEKRMATLLANKLAIRELVVVVPKSNVILKMVTAAIGLAVGVKITIREELASDGAPADAPVYGSESNACSAE